MRGWVAGEAAPILLCSDEEAVETRVTSVRAETRIDRSCSQVWEILADLGTVSLWDPGVAESRQTSADGGQGATRYCRLHSRRRKTIGYMEERASRWREGQGVVFEVYDTNMPVTSHVIAYELDEDGDGTVVRAEREYELKYGPLGRLADSLTGRRRMERGTRELLAGLKHYAETGEPIEAQAPPS